MVIVLFEAAVAVGIELVPEIEREAAVEGEVEFDTADVTEVTAVAPAGM